MMKSTVETYVTCDCDLANELRLGASNLMHLGLLLKGDQRDTDDCPNSRARKREV